MSKTIVVALGGNALQRGKAASAAAQQQAARLAAAQLVSLVQAGNRLVVVHGNGPQVGNIVLHEEAIDTPEVPSMPLDTCGAMSQGSIGYWLQQAFYEALADAGLKLPAVSLVTQTVVNVSDPAFMNPTKPIGPFYSELEARRVAEEKRITVKEDAGRGWRKVVPSPQPIRIVEQAAIAALANTGAVVIAAGGGGVPVIETASGLRGVEAVIDKDFSAAVLADALGADQLIILTSVDAVKINFGTPQEKSLGDISADELEKYAAEGQFAAGSMLPKVRAAVQFVAGAPGRQAVIAALDTAAKAASGQAGTRLFS